MKTESSAEMRKRRWAWLATGAILFVSAVALLLLIPANTTPQWARYRQSSGRDLAVLVSGYLDHARGCETERVFPVAEGAIAADWTSPADVAGALAQMPRLNKGKLWCCFDRNETLRIKDVPKEILVKGPVAENNLKSVRPLSWAVAVNVPKAGIGDRNFPLLWTRGLQEDGTWAENSPWRGRGGYVAFANGEVRFASHIGLLELIDETGAAITTLSQLLGDSGAVVLEDKPAEN